MRPTGTLVPTLPDHAFAMGDDAANHRVGTGGVGTALGQTQRVGHVQVVKDGERGGHAAMVTPPAWMHAMPSLCQPRLAPTEADICTNQGWHPPGRCAGSAGRWPAPLLVEADLGRRCGIGANQGWHLPGRCAGSAGRWPAPLLVDADLGRRCGIGANQGWHPPGRCAGSAGRWPAAAVGIRATLRASPPGSAPPAQRAARRRSRPAPSPSRCAALRVPSRAAAGTTQRRRPGRRPPASAPRPPAQRPARARAGWPRTPGGVAAAGERLPAGPRCPRRARC
ncbi:hypothetical protein G6F31_014731 [Rhizopus arrhizus]|nr:hypothetical protein G6F31_014731 [Rhizopus arrhizus]